MNDKHLLMQFLSLLHSIVTKQLGMQLPASILDWDPHRSSENA